ncbi:MAG TPA: bifunctional indole-3-glycerol-phosphate synthase TrpC/phosphoribosylanthranilate isomerase TrpF [Pyrinomonadaceae bacterium]|jgi:indole-3-glycerol phosphate synthase/phosphoribosylanthranilate isomerase
MDVLAEIISKKRERVEESKRTVPLERVRSDAFVKRHVSTPHALRRALQADGINVIAEFKRRSPSKGLIRADADLAWLVQSYERGGAAAISVLTEEDYFDGSLDDLRAVKQAVDLPVLRKDFVFDEYQVYESAAAGADALLLIVAALDDGQLAALRRLAEDELGMDALVEVHDAHEMDRAVKCGARIIGVNNRNLRTFEVSLETSVQLVPLAPGEALLVSESGLNEPGDLQRLREHGFHGFLIGESLMRAYRPARKLRELRSGIADQVFVKICGITNVADAFAAIEAGADALGFNFYPRSPRYVSPESVREIVNQLPESILNVGVFVNEDLPSLLRIAEESGISAIQLHGDESPEYCRELDGYYLIKAFGAAKDFEPQQAADYEYDVEAIMLDAKDDALRGGTGRVFDWSIAERVERLIPELFLAGGLSPENVAEAVKTVRPYAVDACSSLEETPGKKNHERVRAFVKAARSITP